MKYTVIGGISLHATVSIIVEADSEDEAFALAYEQANNEPIALFEEGEIVSHDVEFDDIEGES